MRNGEALLRAEDVTKYYGSVLALSHAAVEVFPGNVTCLLGDNGAGKSTLIRILAGAVRPDTGTIYFANQPVRFTSPKDALDLGIATVYQDLGIVPVMPVYRNFFLGREPRKGRGVLKRLDVERAKSDTRRELDEMGIHVANVERSISTLSGGERQCVAIARAMHFGARVLILDEPTSALGVREAEMVLRHIVRGRSQGVGVILISHNVQHAYAVGDRFTILNRGSVSETVDKRGISMTDLVLHMAGGEEFERLAAALEQERRGDG